jgi:hypothetical protein
MLDNDVFASRVRILEVGYIINITAYYQPAIIYAGMLRDFLRSHNYVIAAAVNDIASAEGGHWYGTWLPKAHGRTVVYRHSIEEGGRALAAGAGAGWRRNACRGGAGAERKELRAKGGEQAAEGGRHRRRFSATR